MSQYYIHKDRPGILYRETRGNWKFSGLNARAKGKWLNLAVIIKAGGERQPAELIKEGILQRIDRIDAKLMML